LFTTAARRSRQLLFRVLAALRRFAGSRTLAAAGLTLTGRTFSPSPPSSWRSFRTRSPSPPPRSERQAPMPSPRSNPSDS